MEAGAAVLGPGTMNVHCTLAWLKIGLLLIQIRVVAIEVPKKMFIKHFFSFFYDPKGLCSGLKV